MPECKSQIQSQIIANELDATLELDGWIFEVSQGKVPNVVIVTVIVEEANAY